MSKRSNDASTPEAQGSSNSSPELSPILDSDEAAALLKIHPKTLQRMARSGEIPGGFQIGKLWRFRATKLHEWLDEKAS
jgi:excisionase family DNA binding protein